MRCVTATARARSFSERLEQRGVEAAEREQVPRRSSGSVAVERFARSRAEQLAARGSGDALIRHDLEGRGIAAEHIETALEALAPERERATQLAERRGHSVKTARYLASRGFGADALEGLVAQED